MMSNWFRSLLFVTLCGVETGQSYAKLSLTMTVYPGFGEGRVKMTCSSNPFSNERHNPFGNEVDGLLCSWKVG